MLRSSLMRKVHASWLIAFACMGIVAGVTLARDVPLGTFMSMTWLMSGLALVLTSLFRSYAWMILLAVVGGLLIGLWRGSSTKADLALYEQLIGANVQLKGKVLEDTDTNARGQLVIRLGDLVIKDTKLTGSVWVTTINKGMIKRSDTITLNGKLAPGFGNFAAAMYDADIKRIEHPMPGDVALRIRDWFAGGVTNALQETEASLGLGYLVGQRRGLPEDLDKALQAAGLTHIVVASGYNLTILVRFARRLFEKVSKYLSLLASGGMILSFIAITGLSPSMSRAGLVAGLSLLAWYYGRRFHPLILLPLAMAITLIFQPSYAWGDLGWLLSFAAFAGVMILAPLLKVYFFGDKPEKPLRRILIETISAQLCTLPILLIAFGQFSLIAPIANIAILPLVPLAMLLTFIAGIGGLALPAAATIIGFPAQLLLTYMTQTAQFMGNLPWAVQELQVSVFMGMTLYVALAAFAVYMWRVTGYNLRNSSLVE